MIYRGTATEMILKALLYKTHSFKDVEKMLRKHKLYKNKSSASIRNILYRLEKKKLVSKTPSGWSVSQLAKATMTNRSNFNKRNYQMVRNKKGDEENKMIVMYDIPEDLRRKREILREGLKALGFKQKQQSVWIGPSPLPREFIEYLNELKIIEYINFFHVRKQDIV